MLTACTIHACLAAGIRRRVRTLGNKLRSKQSAFRNPHRTLLPGCSTAMHSAFSQKMRSAGLDCPQPRQVRAATAGAGSGRRRCGSNYGLRVGRGHHLATLQQITIGGAAGLGRRRGGSRSTGAGRRRFEVASGEDALMGVELDVRPKEFFQSWDPVHRHGAELFQAGQPVGERYRPGYFLRPESIPNWSDHRNPTS